jgi:hypothetical protein
MAIPSKQIGQPSSTKAALLWDISKQLELMTQVAGNVVVPQITTIYSNELSFPISYTSMILRCNNTGNNLGNYIYTSETVNDINELVTLFNNNLEAAAIGTYSASGSNVLALTTTKSIEACCVGDAVYIDVFND